MDLFLWMFMKCSFGEEGAEVGGRKRIGKSRNLRKVYAASECTPRSGKISSFMSLGGRQETFAFIKAKRSNTFSEACSQNM